MSYELTINRVGALAGVPRRRRGAKMQADYAEVERRFRQQADWLRDSGHFKDASQALLDIARSHDPNAHEFHDPSFDDEDGVIDVFSVQDKPSVLDAQAPLLALMPSRRMRCSVKGINWIVRTRATVTACALQMNGGFTKLWWTFEGIPADPKPERRPTELQATAFLKMTNQMAEEARPLLHLAYRDALARVGHKQEFPLLNKQIRVSMSDNDDRELGVLFDAMSFSKLQPSEIRANRSAEIAPARRAMLEFDDFVRKLTGIKVNPPDKAVHLADDVPGMRGIVYSKDDARRGPCVAGVARRLGSRSGDWFLSPELQMETKKESYLRAVSAARPLSAKLAHDKARELDPI